MNGSDVGIGADVLGAPFILVAMGAWIAIALAFLAQVFDKVSYTTRLFFVLGVLVHIVGMLCLWMWTYMSSDGGDAGGFALAGTALPLVGLVLFSVGLLRRK